MKHPYLEVTYRRGRPLAAYLYLPRQPGDVSVRTERVQGGLLVDFSADGRPLGIEIPSPSRFELSAVNETLLGLGLEGVPPEDFSPLVAA